LWAYQLTIVSANVFGSSDQGLAVNLYINFEVFTVLKYMGPGFLAPLLGNWRYHDKQFVS